VKTLEGSLKLITKALLETTTCNSSLTEVIVHNDGHQSEEFGMILRNAMEANLQWMKRGH
jgi:hypothetical protein